MSDVTEQIKERVGVVELIGQYLKLDRAGSNYKGLCPFHNEKTPSFMVNPERNFWYCFGCRRGGDVFSFVMEMEGIEFREALERLAQQAGVEIPRYSTDNKEEKNQKRRVLDILEAATKFYQFQLQKHPKGSEALKYLINRKITQKQIDDFRIGYAPDGWRHIVQYLLQKGYKLPDINASGLLVPKENQPGEYYDRFRDRIVFPVLDLNGQVVGYSARVMPGSDEKGAKYINTPQTIVYDKSRVLFGLYQAKTEIKKSNFVIIVEGNLDVIASHAGSLGNIVAVSGTALTQEQVKIMKRYSENFKLCFDMDEAGQSATAKSIQTCLQEGADVEVVLLPLGCKDVNDLVISNSTQWPVVVGKALPVMKYFFETTLKKYDRNNVKDKKSIAQKLLNVIKDISDPIEQNYWLKKLSSAIEVDEDVLTKVLEKARMKKDTTPLSKSNIREKENNAHNKPRKIVLQQRLLGLFSLFRLELESEIENFDISILSPENHELWLHLKAGKRSDIEKLINEYELAVKYYYDEKEGFVENKINPYKEWQVTVEEIEKEGKREKLKKISWDIKRASQLQDEQALKVLLEEFSELSTEIEEKPPAE